MASSSQVEIPAGTAAGRMARLASLAPQLVDTSAPRRGSGLCTRMLRMPLLLDEMTEPDRPVTRRELRDELIWLVSTLETKLASKRDLKRSATKEDLKQFATKEDLKRFATKEDLERFATKEDLKRFATKQGLDRF